jgi:hypothetical protein
MSLFVFVHLPPLFLSPLLSLFISLFIFYHFS